ncbi:hypothetical protein Shal_3204 [Shewanella halifaxensis HAW-EB4]|uniref:Uncharacterized protein n=1 Tax=Shewanella halifaxensis (strain HAW-EB4) TaxID=458817 RepID=B0TR20_SHEHH|nr:hypothetical protein Shal_3204 [Shewanella halifaxensis HAW-EB4]
MIIKGNVYTLPFLLAQLCQCFTITMSYTNQYKHLVAQREFSGFEARQRVQGIVILRLSSLTQHQNR